MQSKDVKGKPDFYFPSRRVAVFVDGCFWHGCERCGHLPRKNSAYWNAKIGGNRERDERTTAAIRASGITVIRFWEHQLREDLGGCVATVLEAVAGGRGNMP